MIPLLTIAVPTFNRAAHLAVQLDLLLPQIAELENVHVLVCDNNSTDETEKTVRERQRFTDRLRYFHQEENVGLYGNVLSAYELSEGKYVWYLADDDPVEKDAVQRIVQLLTDEEHRVLVLAAKGPDGRVVSGQRDFYDWDSPGAVENLFSVISLMTLVLRKETLQLGSLKGRAPNAFPQVTLALLLLKKEMHLSERPVVVIRRHPGHVTKNFFKLYCLELHDAIRYAKWVDVEEKLMNYAAKTTLREFVRLQFLERMGVFHSRAGLPFDTWRRGWSELGNTLSKKCVLLIILLISRTPRFISKMMGFTFLLLRSRSVTQAKRNMDLLLAWQHDARMSDV